MPFHPDFPVTSTSQEQGAWVVFSGCPGRAAPEKLAIANVGKVDAKRRLRGEMDTLMSSNIKQCLGSMLDTVVFRQEARLCFVLFVLFLVPTPCPASGFVPRSSTMPGTKVLTC